MARLVFFGNERLASAVEESGILLNTLIDDGHEISHLVINNAEKTSRNKKEDAVIKIANAHNIPIVDHWEQQSILDIASQAEGAVLASFGRIIHEDIINAFPSGIVNIHPSLLPRYRGTTPIESAILSEDAITGVSLMALSRIMDAGNVYGQIEYQLQGNETKQELYDHLSERGAQLLTQHMADILAGKNTGKTQKEDEATFTKMMLKSDGEIDWDQPASVIERQIRAFAGWPGSKAVIGGHVLTITSARVSDQNGTPGQYDVVDKEIVVACGNGSLIIDKLKPAGKSEMPTGAFLAGNSI